MRQIAVHNGKKPTLLGEYASVLGTTILRHRAGIAERARRVEAERANQVTTQFIANMSHELRTPLNAILGFSKILQDPEKLSLDSGKIKEYSVVIHETAEQLLSIINEILDISKIQSGKLTIDKQQVLVSEVLHSCIAMIKIAAQNKKIDLLTKIDQNLPPVMGDPVKLKQIFTNIVNCEVYAEGRQHRYFCFSEGRLPCVRPDRRYRYWNDTRRNCRSRHPIRTGKFGSKPRVRRYWSRTSHREGAYKDA